MPQFQLAVPQLYNERAMCVRLSPAGSRGRRNRAPPSRCRVPRASEGLPGEAAVRCAGLLSAHTRLLRMPPWIRTAEEQSRKVAALRGGTSVKCPSASTERRSKVAGHGEVSAARPAAGRAGLRTLPARGDGKAGCRRRGGEARSRRANKTRQGSPEPGERAALPSPAASSRRPPPARPRGLPAGRREVRGGRSPRGRGARRRPQEKEVSSRPSPPTGPRHRGAGKTPLLPPLWFPRGSRGRPSCAPHTAPGPLPAGRPAGTLPARRRAPANFRASVGGRGKGSCAAVETGGRAECGSSGQRGGGDTGRGGQAPGATRLKKQQIKKF